MAALAGVADPEDKRKIIGREFVARVPGRSGQAAEREVARAGHDLSGRHRIGRRQDGKATTIKSHHNVGGLPETLHLKLLEPLRELFKDEVRALGLALGCRRDGPPPSVPGPGLGVRILGEVRRSTPTCCAAPTRSSSTMRDEGDRAAPPPAGRPTRSAKSGAQPGVRGVPAGASVGVMGDGRTYEHVAALRAVQTQDFMTAHWAPCRTSCSGGVNRIINEVRGINRVVYDVSGKPPATIEWE
jgi:GMP synthase (glutamine-hydrolysing)